MNSPAFWTTVFITFMTSSSVIAFETVNDIWGQSTVGQCFESIDAYMIKTFGMEYRADENLQAISGDLELTGTLQNDFKWVIDFTPTVNYSRTLFRIGRNGKACIILEAPFSTSLAFATGKGKLPLYIVATDSPHSGSMGNEITYRLNAESRYSPAICRQTSHFRRKKIIRCKDAFRYPLDDRTK